MGNRLLEGIHHLLANQVLGWNYVAQIELERLLENIDAAARIASENIDYLSDQYAPAEYRRQLVKTEISRALSGLRDRLSS